MLKTKHKQQFCYFPSSACKDSPGLFSIHYGIYCVCERCWFGLVTYVRKLAGDCGMAYVVSIFPMVKLK